MPGTPSSYPVIRSYLPRLRAITKSKESKGGERVKGRFAPRRHRIIFIDSKAGALLSPDPWNHSWVTQEKLQGLINDGLLRPITNPVTPEWIVPGEDVEQPDPLEGYVLSFMAFHEWRLGVPVS